MDKIRGVSIECSKCAARDNGLCAEMTAVDLAKVRRLKLGDRKIAAGKDIFGPGTPSDAIYNLVEGWAFRYSLLEDGRRQILDFVLPGALLGFHPAKGARATYGVQALTEVVVCAIPTKNLVPLSQEIPETGLRLAWLTARDRSLAYDHLTSIGRQSARERVAHLILELFIRYRAQWPGHRTEEMHLPLTQEHVGDATGLTSVHVNRVLQDLRKEGVLEFHYRRLRVLNPDRLVEIAEIDPHLAMHWTHKAACPDELPQAAGEQPRTSARSPSPQPLHSGAGSADSDRVGAKASRRGRQSQADATPQAC